MDKHSIPEGARVARDLNEEIDLETVPLRTVNTDPDSAVDSPETSDKRGPGRGVPDLEQLPGRSKKSSLLQCLKPNKAHVYIKMHYFWRLMAAAPFWMFLTQMVRQRGVSPEGIGFIYSFLPVLSLVCGSVLTWVIDYFRVHRASLVVVVIITAFSLSMIYWAPDVGPKVLEGNVTQVSEPKNYNHQNSSSANGDNTVITATSCTSEECPDNEDFIPANFTTPFITNESLSRGEDTPSDNDSPEEGMLSVSQLTKLPGFWYIFALLFIQSAASFLSDTLTDTICCRVLGKDTLLLGRQLLFGSLAWTISALVSGLLVDLYSANLPERDYLPSFIMVILFTLVDVFVLVRMKVNGLEAEKAQPKDFLRVFRSPKNLIFFLTVLIIRAALGIMSLFYALLLEDIANAWDPNFGFLKTLQGIIMVIRAVFGEMIVLSSTNYIIKRVGVTGSLVLVLLNFSVRYILYYTVTNPWYFLPIEFLHGFNYGLFKVAIVYHANNIAPAGSTATILSVLKILSFLAKSLAGATGGFLWATYGGHGTFLATGIFLIFYNIFFVIVSFIISRCCQSANQNIGE
ncbi:uncharacterized protein LOC143032350 [Oratosquilla oratoria]|uniref:uncharacterized protein LOC143032350 n=1 Tax=Oratosquilla oratoria TaxID=337810 RepID=UPI003F76C056